MRRRRWDDHLSEAHLDERSVICKKTRRRRWMRRWVSSPCYLRALVSRHPKPSVQVFTRREFLNRCFLLTKNALGDAVSVIQDSNEEERGRLAIRETGVNLVAASVSLVPTAEIVREALLGGFAMELTTSSEAKSISAPGPCVAVGSLLPGHPLWYLAPCSPRTTIQGWGTAGIACTLSLLMGMELGKVPRVRAIRPALKMSAIGAIYTMGPNVWRDPAVSAPLGLLTDLYWRRMVKNYIQAYHQGVRGYSMDLGSFSAGEGGLNDPLQQAQGTGDAAAAAAMVNCVRQRKLRRRALCETRCNVAPSARLPEGSRRGMDCA